MLKKFFAQHLKLYPLLANSANNINWPSKNFVWNFVGVTNFVLVSLQNLSPFEKPMPIWGSFSIFWVGHNINISARAGLVQDCQDPAVGFTFISNQTVPGQDWVRVFFGTVDWANCPLPRSHLMMNEQSLNWFIHKTVGYVWNFV